MMKTVRALFVTTVTALTAFGCAAPTGTEETQESMPEAVTLTSSESALTTATNEDSGWLPFEGVAANSCNGEDINTRGFSRDTLKIRDDGAGNVRITVTNRLALTGVGVTSGALYRSNEGLKSVEITRASGVTKSFFTVRGVFRTSHPGGADLRYRIVSKVVTNAAGETKVLVDKFDIDCP